DRNVTGVQTCALPIFAIAARAARTPVSSVGSSTGKKRGEWFFAGFSSSFAAPPKNQNILGTSIASAKCPKSSDPINGGLSTTLRSEERRVGTEGTACW